MKPTNKAHFLAEKLPEIWRDLEEVINHEEEFQIEKLSGQLNIALHPLYIDLLSDKLFIELKQRASNVQLVISVWSNDTEAQLLEGKLDFGITIDPLDMSKEVSQRRLPKLYAKLYLNNQHPLIDEQINQHTFSKYALAILHVRGWNEHITYTERYLSRFGVTPKIEYRSPHPSSILNVVSQTQLLHPIVANYYDLSSEQVSKKFIYIEDSPLMLDSAFCYHYRHRNSPIHQWFYETIEDMLQHEYRRDHVQLESVAPCFDARAETIL
ncbi:LysR substrate-binding domain-containing protein [Shewanella maritima]|uniref:LysR substrate-binding domain-containing protein n=1 Tax=Shewanella maritima TaxID=2520507 RepID=UPI001F5F0AB7|nr:LysR family transcriptional regulator [Shewanella maritima]